MIGVVMMVVGARGMLFGVCVKGNEHGPLFLARYSFYTSHIGSTPLLIGCYISAVDRRSKADDALFQLQQTSASESLHPCNLLVNWEIVHHPLGLNPMILVS